MVQDDPQTHRRLRRRAVDQAREAVLGSAHRSMTSRTASSGSPRIRSVSRSSMPRASGRSRRRRAKSCASIPERGQARRAGRPRCLRQRSPGCRRSPRFDRTDVFPERAVGRRIGALSLRRCSMPRYVIERDFGLVGEEEMQEVAARSKATGIEQFPDIEWEHSHVCSDGRGRSRASACTAHRVLTVSVSTPTASVACGDQGLRDRRGRQSGGGRALTAARVGDAAVGLGGVSGRGCP